MVPCCLEIISREEHDRLVEENAKRPILGSAFGKHHSCPKSAKEAHQILNQESSNSYIQIYEKYSLASILIKCLLPLRLKLYNISILDQKNDAPESRECISTGQTCMSNSECCSQNCKDDGTCGTWQD